MPKKPPVKPIVKKKEEPIQKIEPPKSEPQPTEDEAVPKLHALQQEEIDSFVDPDEAKE